jgi:hypothetical protein
MDFIEFFRMYCNGKISEDLLISEVKKNYVENSIARRPPDDLMIISSVMIINAFNKYDQKNKLINMIPLAAFILKETGDQDAVLLLLSFVPSSGHYLRRILKTHNLSCLIPFIRQ